MARAHFVKKARKDYPNHGIKKGDSYYWWQFRFGPKMKQKNPPKRSQLTQSDFLSQYYDLADNVRDRFRDCRDEESFDTEIQTLIDEIEDLRSEVEDRLNSMPDHLQESSSSGELLQERIYALEDWISELESIDRSFSDEGQIDEDIEDRITEIVDEIEAADPGL